MGRTPGVVIAVVLCGASVATGAGLAPRELQGKVAFLRGGEVWIGNGDGTHERPISSARGRVSIFLFSPDLRHLAHTVASAGGETTSVAVIDLDRGTRVKDIGPKVGISIWPHAWASPRRLVTWSGDGLVSMGAGDLDLATGVYRPACEGDGEPCMPFEEQLRLDVSTFTPDGAQVLYTDDSGLGPAFRTHLHLLEAASGQERVVMSRPSILQPALSHDRCHAAFIEVDWPGQLDVVWVVDAAGGGIGRAIWQGTVRTCCGMRPGVAWSPDDSWLVADTSPAQAVEVATGRSLLIPAHEFSWLSPDELLVAVDRHVELWDLGAGTTRRFLEDAHAPCVLRRLVP